MAERYGHNPHVIGWQIDNEYQNISYDSNTRAQFQQWLEARYRTLTDLNERWTTTYWSQTYSDWAQIPIPTQQGNPGLFISWMRFVSDTWRSYQKNQADVIRAFNNGQFITSNFMGWFGGFDHYTVTQDLDLAAWDDYPEKGHLDPVRNGATRGRADWSRVRRSRFSFGGYLRAFKCCDYTVIRQPVGDRLAAA